jgi:hypothetical protein
LIFIRPLVDKHLKASDNNHDWKQVQHINIVYGVLRTIIRGARPGTEGLLNAKCLSITVAVLRIMVWLNPMSGIGNIYIEDIWGSNLRRNFTRYYDEIAKPSDIPLPPDPKNYCMRPVWAAAFPDFRPAESLNLCRKRTLKGRAGDDEEEEEEVKFSYLARTVRSF